MLSAGRVWQPPIEGAPALGVAVGSGGVAVGTGVAVRTGVGVQVGDGVGVRLGEAVALGLGVGPVTCMTELALTAPALALSV
jgi:hypothetical protein